MSMKKRVLITDDVHPHLLSALEEIGFLIDYEPDISLLETKNKILNYHGVVVNTKIKIDSSFLQAAHNLHFIARLGSGLDTIDVTAAENKGIKVFSSPEGNAQAVAEHALGMLLALANNFLPADREVRQKLWRREANRGLELAGKTLGIYGFGHNGSQLGRITASLNLHVLAYDKYKPAGYSKGLAHVQEVSADYLCAHADFISFHLPLTEETHHLVDQAFLQKCKPGLILINTSRGPVVHTAALLEALEVGLVSKAGLDVFENEKVATFTPEEDDMYRRLYALPQVLLTPHIAGWTVESKYKIAAVLAEKIADQVSKGLL